MTYIAEPLRRQVFNRAANRCEYCRLHQDHTYFTHEIDHIYAEKHGGKTNEANLCLACADCNRHKSSDICSLDPRTGDVVALYHPRNDQWEDHFTVQTDGLIALLSAKARVTAQVLNFNDGELVVERARLIMLGLF